MSEISRLILARGGAEAQRAQAKGQMWADLVGGVSAGFGNILESRQQMKAAQARRNAVTKAFSGTEPPSLADMVAAGIEPQDAIKILSDYAKTKPPAPEPFTLSEGQTRYGAGGEVIAAQPQTPKAPEGFTLSEGQQRFDANGQPIANVPKPAEVKPGPKAGSEEDFVTRAAAEMGTTADKLTAKQVESIRRRYAQSTRFVEPKTGGDFEWVTRGGKPLQIQKGTAQPGDVPYDAVAARQQQGGNPASSAYSAERATRILSSIDAIKKRVGIFNTGPGAVLQNLPGTDARKLAGDIKELQANIAFNELTEMRAASSTGGALGQIAVRELELLQSALGSLDQYLAPADLIANLGKIKATVERWNAAKAQQSKGGSNGAPLQTNGPIDLGGGFKILGVSP